MTTDTNAGAIMQADCPALLPEMPIRRAVALLVEGGHDAAPVVDDSGALVGILTQKDCFRPALHASYYQEWSGTVADHMTKGAVSLAAGDDLMLAATAFADHPHRVFPVLDQGRPVGMLRRSDVLAALLRLG